MKAKKSLMVAAAVATVGLGSIAGLGMASADTGSGNGVSGMVDKIATKFNLNKDDVQKVFDEEKTERQAEHQAEMSERLQDAVDNGKITAEQKTKIEEKIKEITTAREAERAELKAWAEQNGIDMKYLMGRGHHGNDDRLQDAVDDGDITAEQKTLIENKQEELETKREATHDELEKWAEDNGIDEKYLMMGHGKGHGRMGGGGPR